MNSRKQTYRFDVQVTGYVTVAVTATSLRQAESKASERFDRDYLTQPIEVMGSKTLVLQLLGIGGEEPT